MYNHDYPVMEVRYITQNRVISDLNQSEIPIGEENSIQIMADGFQAKCFMRGVPEDAWISDKIVIVFDENHPEYGEFFMTKNFRFDGPGILRYGYEDKMIKVQRIITE